MYFLVIYAAVVVLSLSTYLIIKGYLELNDVRDCCSYLKRLISDRFTLSSNAREYSNSLKDQADVSFTGNELEKCLKHLEYIGQFETYLNRNEDCLISLDFLHELEKSKYDTQVSILRTTGILNSTYNKQAA